MVMDNKYTDVPTACKGCVFWGDGCHHVEASRSKPKNANYELGDILYCRWKEVDETVDTFSEEQA